MVGHVGRVIAFDAAQSDRVESPVNTPIVEEPKAAAAWSDEDGIDSPPKWLRPSDMWSPNALVLPDFGDGGPGWKVAEASVRAARGSLMAGLFSLENHPQWLRVGYPELDEAAAHLDCCARALAAGVGLVPFEDPGARGHLRASLVQMSEAIGQLRASQGAQLPLDPYPNPASRYAGAVTGLRDALMHLAAVVCTGQDRDNLVSAASALNRHAFDDARLHLALLPDEPPRSLPGPGVSNLWSKLGNLLNPSSWGCWNVSAPVGVPADDPDVSNESRG